MKRKWWQSRDDRPALEAMRGMSWRDRTDYIWTYFKYHILAGVVVLAVLAYTVNAFFLHPAKQQYLAVGVYGGYLMDEAQVALRARMDALVPIELRDTREAIVYGFQVNAQDLEYAYAVVNQFHALIWTGDLEVLIAEPPEIERLAAASLLIPLDEMLTEKELAAVESRMVYAAPEDGEQAAYAVSGGAYLKQTLLNMPEASVCFVAGSKRPEAALEAFWDLTGH